MKLRSVIVVGMIAATAVAVSSPRAQGAAALVGPITWQSAGDSFSSGEGIDGNVGDCAQSELAYGPSTEARLPPTWPMGSVTFTACSGRLVEDYFHSEPSTPYKGSLWDWGHLDQRGPERVDILTMSFGGNDIGFPEVMFECAFGLPATWSSFTSNLSPGSIVYGCKTTEQELDARIDALLDPTKLNCTGTRGQGTDSFECPLWLETRRGSIIDFYYDLVTQHLTDRGDLFIVGYPSLFAPVGEWPLWSQIGCESVSRGDAQMLARVADHFNTKLSEAVKRANAALGADRVHYIDRHALYRAGQHELCGAGEDWLNGVKFDRGPGTFRKESNFHPNAAGHDAVATALLARVQKSFDPTAAPFTPSADKVLSANVPSICEHPAGKLVNGELPLKPNADGSDPGYLSFSGQSAVGDVDGDGHLELAAVFGCSGGGVSWPDHLVVFNETMKVIGDVDIGTIFPDLTPWRGTIQSLKYAAGKFVATALLTMVGAVENTTAERTFSVHLVNGQAAVEVSPPPTVTGLVLGSSGPGVVALQQELIDRGYKIIADGQFGPGTEAAVRDVQTNLLVLRVDGQVGPATATSLGLGTEEDGGYASIDAFTVDLLSWLNTSAAGSLPADARTALANWGGSTIPGTSWSATDAYAGPGDRTIVGFVLAGDGGVYNGVDVCITPQFTWCGVWSAFYH